MKNAPMLALVLPVSSKRIEILFMKPLILIFILFSSCVRQDKRPISYIPVSVESRELTAHAGPMFQRFKDSLDLYHVKMVLGIENVKIYMAKFKSNSNRIYAVSSFGQEVFYAAMMQDEQNGKMAVLKNGSAVLISVKKGVTQISDLDRKQWSYYFTTEYHGGPGFCQRMPGESFSTCYKAEADEFCDSFISCIAVNTQPIVVITIAIACTCKAEPYPPLHLIDSLDYLPPSDNDTLLHFYKDSFQIVLDTLL